MRGLSRKWVRLCAAERTPPASRSPCRGTGSRRGRSGHAAVVPCVLGVNAAVHALTAFWAAAKTSRADVVPARCFVPSTLHNELVNWTPFVGPRGVEFKVRSRLPLSFKNQAASCCFCLCCGYVVNGFALSKRSGISTALAAASILSMPARHTAIGIGCSSPGEGAENCKRSSRP